MVPPPPPTPGGVVTTPGAPPSALPPASGTATGQLGHQILTPTVASVSNAQLPSTPPSVLPPASGTATGQIGHQILTPTVASVSNAQLPSKSCTPFQTTSNPSMSAVSTSTIVIPIMGRLIAISTTDDAIASGGKSKADWSGLADPTAPVAYLNQVRESESFTKSWKRQAPLPGQPNMKDFKGTKFHWCGKCCRWSTTHGTTPEAPAQHKGKSSNPTANVAAIPEYDYPAAWMSAMHVADREEVARGRSWIDWLVNVSVMICWVSLVSFLFGTQVEREQCR